MSSYKEAKQAYLRSIGQDPRTGNALTMAGIDWWLNQRQDREVDEDRQILKDLRSRWMDLELSVSLDPMRQLEIEDPELAKKFNSLEARANIWIAQQMVKQLKEQNKKIPQELVDFLTYSGL